MRVSWGATQGNPLTGKGVIGGETMAFLNRLEVLGEALLLNDEFINSCNYNAATDQVKKKGDPPWWMYYLVWTVLTSIAARHPPPLTKKWGSF